MKNNTALLTRMAILVALGVALSTSSILLPGVGAKVFPAQHAINVIAGALVGPWYGAVVAVAISLLRLALGTGTPLALPGSVFGVILAGLAYRYTKSRLAAMGGEVVGTGVVGALVAYPVAVFLLGNTKAAAAGATFFMFSFGTSSATGAVLGGMVLAAIERFVPAAQAKARA